MTVTVNGNSNGQALILRVYKEAVPVIVFTVLAELFAGSLLLSLEYGHFANLVGLFVLVPGLMQIRGNISTSLAQRLGSGTHLGTISWVQGLNKPLQANIKAAFSLVIVMSFSLGIGAWAVTRITIFLLILQGIPILLPVLSLAQFLTIAIITALLASSLQVTITVTVALQAHARGLDPDNITIPIVATIGDIITIACLLASLMVAIGIPPMPI